jgi:hypothetical protein
MKTTSSVADSGRVRLGAGVGALPRPSKGTVATKDSGRVKLGAGVGSLPRRG